MQKKLFVKGIFLVGMLLVAVFVLGCQNPNTSKRGGGRTPREITPWTSTKTIAGTERVVKTVLYVETNDDNPLNALGYRLDGGTPEDPSDDNEYFFDGVILFAANIRNRNCAAESSTVCTKSGPHVHLNNKLQYILDNKAQFIEPLQDAGIAVFLGLLGDHDGISFSTMNDADRAAFVADLKAVVEKYELDGVDFDDEWAGKEDWGEIIDGDPQNWDGNTPSPNSIWVYPVSSYGWPISVRVYRDPAKGVEPGNGILTAPSQQDVNRMWAELGETYFKTIKAVRQALGNERVIGLYEYNTGRYITQNGDTNGEATASELSNLVDYALQPWYSDWYADSANGISRKKYSPMAIDLGGNAYNQGNKPMPPLDEDGPSYIGPLWQQVEGYKEAVEMGNSYGVLYVYRLKRSSETFSDNNNSSVKDYLSELSTSLFGQDIILDGPAGNHTNTPWAGLDG